MGPALLPTFLQVRKVGRENKYQLSNKSFILASSNITKIKTFYKDIDQMLWIALLILLLKKGFNQQTIACGYRKNNREVGFKYRKKPTWVIKRILHFKALMPHAGCRHLANTFNRQFGHRETVSKTWVNTTVRKYKHDILLLRKKIKNRIPKPQAMNQIWGVDLTGKYDLQKQNQQIIGVIDHGSRACLMLKALKDKSSITLLRYLLDSIETYGKPKTIRTDNEPVFTSRLFRFGLWFLGIKHQRTDVGCPWQNGRVERFFGTLKEKLNQIAVLHCGHLNDHLRDFRFWYNHVRTHQHLEFRTPAEVWSGKGFKRKATFYSGWDGLLTGFYHPPDG